MKRRVLVTGGAGGQLGRELERHVPGDVQLWNLSRQRLDVTDPDAVNAAVTRFRPDWIINAAAYTAVDRAEQDPSRAHAVNGEGVGHLARAAAAGGARLLQVSTDFVFDGRRGSPYQPGDAPNPLNVYGASKLAGERQALETLGQKAVIMRTAWVYASHGNNFVRTMLRLMNERDNLRVVADQVGSPTWAGGLARAVWLSVERELGGIHHWTDAGVASWYDFAVAIQEEALARGLLRRAATLHPVSSAEFPGPARRPSYSVLDKGPTWRALDCQADHWRVALRKMLGEFRDG